MMSDVRPGRLDGRVAVITGGASGIGAATVGRFVAEGTAVVFCDLDEVAGKELAGDAPEATRLVPVGDLPEERRRRVLGDNARLAFPI